MCTRYSLDIAAASQVAGLFGLQAALPFCQEVFPSNSCVVLTAQGGQIRPVMAAFGFLPGQGKGLLLNARQESLAQKPMFASALAKGRAIVPAALFYEWDRYGAKTKYAFYARGQAPLLMAGLVRPQADGLHYAIVTRSATVPVSEVHDRMPLLFSEQQARQWLLEDAAVPALLRADLRPPALQREHVGNEAPQQTSLY